MTSAIHPLRIYDDGLRAESSAVTIRMSDGSASPLALQRFLGPADPVDEMLLADVRGPVLDVGCGPGRHLGVLARRNVFALGVDLSVVAVTLARGQGGRAIVASIFDELPGAGSWRTALVLDGNIGIGGEPERLLRRIGELLAPGGEVLAEFDPPGVSSARTAARLETEGGVSQWFRWARIAADEADQHAAQAGFTVASRMEAGGRFFASLTPARAG